MHQQQTQVVRDHHRRAGSGIAGFARQRREQRLHLKHDRREALARRQRRSLDERAQMRADRTFADDPRDEIVARQKGGAVRAREQVKLRALDKGNPKQRRRRDIERRTAAHEKNAAAMAQEKRAKTRGPLHRLRRPSSLRETRLNGGRDESGAMGIDGVGAQRHRRRKVQKY